MMNPSDVEEIDNNHLNLSEQIPLNRKNRWNPQIQQTTTERDNKLNNNNHQQLGKLNGNNTNNNTKNLILNGTNSSTSPTTNNKDHRWSPLAQEEDDKIKLSISELLDKHTPVNNNEWKTIPENSNIDMKNGWKEIPQIEDNNGVHKIQGNNNGSLTNGNSALGNGNGHSDKLNHEQDPLAFQLRIPDIEEISSCGIGSCRPKWARNFASTHVFMVVFLLAWILQVNLINFFF